MIPLSRERRSLLLGIHGWSGAILGLLVYIVVVTGTVSVIAPEIADWSSPLQTPPNAELPSGLDRPLRQLAKQVDPAYHGEVSVFRHAGGRLTAFFHTHRVHPETDRVEEIGVEFDLDPRNYAVLDRRDGWGEEIAKRDTSSALANYLVELHATLHMAPPYGLLIVGISGLALLIAAISGLLVHRHLLRELFTLRGGERPRLARRDAHAVAGAWMLPFAILFGFTGAYFSYAGTIGFPALAEAVADGDEAALAQAMVAVPPGDDGAPARMADVDAMISDAGDRAGAAPNFLAIERWGRADSTVTVFTELPEGDIVGVNYVYAGATGAFRFEKPTFGLVTSVGGALTDLVDWLHFGNFAGALAEIVWFGLGLLVAYGALTGLRLWCGRRQESSGTWRRLAGLTHWVGYGLPFSLAVVPYGFFPARAVGAAETDAAMSGAFIGAIALAALAVLVLRDAKSVTRLLMGLTGVALLGLPVLRLLTGGPAWGTALNAQLYAVLALDVAALLGGIAYLLLAAMRTRFGDYRRTSPERAVAAGKAGPSW